MEKDIVPQAGYELKLIRARGFERGFSRETLSAIKGIFDSLSDARKLLKEEKPDLVIGTGGFTCAMLLFCASLMGIPTMIHEQNAYPGRSNRLMGHFVDRIGISFIDAQDYFDNNKTFLAGNPIRDEFKNLDRAKARKKLNLDEEDQLIIFMGGSQGAEAINEAALYILKNYKNDNAIYYLLAGKDQAQKLEEKVKTLVIDPDRVKIFGYYNDMSSLLAAGDLIVSRSGAMSITEIAASGIPSILIPYPKAAGDHQTYNAQVLSNAKAALLIQEENLTGERLLKAFKLILEDPQVLEAMRNNAYNQRILDADQRFCNEAYQLVEKTKKKSTKKAQT